MSLSLSRPNGRLAIAALAASALFAATAHAGPLPEQACQAAKNKTAGKYAACMQAAAAKLAAAGDAAKFDDAMSKCTAKFTSVWEKLEAKAAEAGAACPDGAPTEGTFRTVIDAHASRIRAALQGDPLQVCGNGTVESPEACDGSELGGATCATQPTFVGGTLRCASGCTLDTSGCYTTRFVDNGDGTVTDRRTGLQWEKKTTAVGSGMNFADPHDVDDVFSWYDSTSWDRMVLHGFLHRLNRSESSDGLPSGLGWQACFTRRCDWRLPTITELKSIIDLGAPGCGTGSPCIDPVFGPTAAGGGDQDRYTSWTKEPFQPALTVHGLMWSVDFRTGNVAPHDVYWAFRTRAVRGSMDYSWVVGAWSACSVACGGGVQSRSVSCQFPTGETVVPTEAVCTGAGPKPATQQSCNTAPC